jgi:hypothetical protein
MFVTCALNLRISVELLIPFCLKAPYCCTHLFIYLYQRRYDQVKEDEMGRAFSTNGGDEKCI